MLRREVAANRTYLRIGIKHIEGNTMTTEIDTHTTHTQKSALPMITGGKLFYSNDHAYLRGVERGIEYANEGALTSLGIFSSNKQPFNFVLVNLFLIDLIYLIY